MGIDRLVKKYEMELKLVEPRFHGEFVHFAENMEASREFMGYLGRSKEAQRAVEMALNREVRELADDVKRYKEQQGLTKKPSYFSRLRSWFNSE